MLIDWFTVGAQALNFLVLVFLMRRFLYKPILHAIDEREKKIAAELADAAAKKAEADKECDEFQKKNEEIEKQRGELLAKAKEEAKVEGQRLVDEAKKAAEVAGARRKESLESDARDLNQAVARRVQQEVFAIARKALSELATTSLEERVAAVFTSRLRAMDGAAKARLGEALKTSRDPLIVRSAFDLPDSERAVIQNALNETFSAAIRLRFETAPEVISGIELSGDGQKVAWSIGDYLVSLEKSVAELLDERAGAGPTDEDKTKSPTKSEPKAASAGKPDERRA